MNNNIETLLPEDKIKKTNKNNKLIIIILILIVLISIIVATRLKKETKDEPNSPIQTEEEKPNTNDTEEPKEPSNKYKCLIDREWEDFGTTDISGNFLGKYKKIDEFIFTVNDNYISDTKYSLIYEFENIDGYAYIGGEKESFVLNEDLENLKKSYVSEKAIPYMYEENITNYIEKLELNGYKCQNEE